MLVHRIPFIALLATFALPSGAPAASFRVDSTVDSPSAKPGDGACVSRAGGCTLRAAVQEANASREAATIVVPAGTYILSIAPEGANFGRSGSLFLGGEITVQGADPSGTILDGGGIDRVFQIPQGARADLSGLTVRNGAARGSDGGGVLNRGSLVMTNVVLQHNRATADPGQPNGRGGALSNEGKTRLMNVKFASNEADGRGGAIFNAESGIIEMMNGGFTSNRSLTDDGGAVASLGEVSLSILALRDNQANQGGGISNIEGKLTLFDVLLAGNRAGANGGGLRNSGVAKLTNVTLGTNEAGVSGGAIANRAQGKVSLNNVTIVRNEAGAQSAGAGKGGGLHNEATSTVDMVNTIIAGNKVVGTVWDCSGPIRSGGYNLIGTQAGCSLGAASQGDILGRAAGVEDLAGRGGPVASYGLAADSPAVDAGNPAAPTGSGGTCARADQRGVKRPQSGRPGDAPRCDIGAFERKPGV